MCMRVGEFIDINYSSSLFKIAHCSMQKARVRFVNEEEEARVSGFLFTFQLTTHCQRLQWEHVVAPGISELIKCRFRPTLSSTPAASLVWHQWTTTISFFLLWLSLLGRGLKKEQQLQYLCNLTSSSLKPMSILHCFSGVWIRPKGATEKRLNYSHPNLGTPTGCQLLL